MRYTIKDFRVFDGDGATFDINPLTILTGCNSSGKSSVVKSMVLLGSYLESLQEAYRRDGQVHLNGCCLDFTKKVNSQLGSFGRILHRGSSEKTITFVVTVHSPMLGEDITVSMAFGRDENDQFDNGWLRRISFLNAEGKVIYSSSADKDGGVIGDLGLLRNGFVRYAIGEGIISSCGGYVAEGKVGEMKAEDLEQWSGDLKTMISAYQENYGDRAFTEVSYCVNRGAKDYVGKLAGGDIRIPAGAAETFFSIPLMDRLGKCGKAELRKAVEDLMPQVKPDECLSILIHKMIDDFESGIYGTFAEYFKAKEEALLRLGDGVRRAPFRSRKADGKVRLLDPGDVSLPQDNRMQGYMFKSGTISIYDEETSEEQSARQKKEWEDWQARPVSFDMLYEVLMTMNDRCVGGESPYYKTFSENIDYDKSYRHKAFAMFMEYASDLLQTVLLRDVYRDISYISTSIVNVRRYYPLDAEDEFTAMLRRYVEARRQYLSQEDTDKVRFVPGSFINRWLNEFEVGESISIDVDGNGLGIATLSLHKAGENGDGEYLSEVGYGITQLFVILLRIEVAIMESEKFHVSLPPFTPDTLGTNPEKDMRRGLVTMAGTVAIEEPEVHLHPCFQSKLADMLADAFLKYHVHFIVETHSEYLIRRLQVLAATGKVSRDSISIIYVDAPDPSKRGLYAPQVRHIGIREDGSLSEAFGKGFFDEADGLAMELLNNKSREDGDA